MKQVLGIGIQDFEEIRMTGNFYIDKTHLIKEWWETNNKVTLITRPRRFGKTLNMSMLNCFFPTGMKTGKICLRAFPSGRKKNTEKCREHTQ